MRSYRCPDSTTRSTENTVIWYADNLYIIFINVVFYGEIPVIVIKML